jgi:predicted phosphodiesterase
MLIKQGSSKVLAIGDIHFPFEHRDMVRFLTDIKKKYRPDMVVQMGDLFDNHSTSRWEHNPDGLSPGDELKLAIKRSKNLFTLFPYATMILGNHDNRSAKKAFSAGLSAHVLSSYSKLMELPDGWHVANECIIDNVRYIHGDGFSGINAHRKAAATAMQSTAIGHIHSHAGVAYLANHNGLYFGLNVGCLIDHHQYAFEYSKFCPDKPILGCAIIDKGIPHFIPMLLNKRNRWVGEL